MELFSLQQPIEKSQNNYLRNSLVHFPKYGKRLLKYNIKQKKKENFNKLFTSQYVNEIIFLNYKNDNFLPCD